jgi:hypothetical protein
VDMEEIKQYAEVLRGIIGEPYDHRPYRNSDGQWGYTVLYRVGNDWYWYSLPGVTQLVTASEVADAIVRGENPTRCGVFKLNGFEATIRSDGQWYMLNKGSERP